MSTRVVGAQRGSQQPVAALDLFQREALAGDVQGHALAGPGLLRGPVLRVQAAHPHRPSGVAEEQFVAHRDPSGEGRAGDHDAAAGDAEGPVHRQAEVSLAATLADSPASPPSASRNASTPSPVLLESGKIGERQRAGGQQVFDLGPHLLHSLRLDPVDLGQRATSARRIPSSSDDRQVLAGLRHQAVAGGHHQHAIDAAGQHVVDEAPWPGTSMKPVGLPSPSAQIAQVDGDPALALGRAAVALGW